MIKTIARSTCLAIAALSLNARAQDVRHYTDGPVTELDYIQVEYGHFAEYVDWLNSTWKPTMEAMKKAGLIIDYKVVSATPRTPDQPNIILMITFKDGAAALDKGVEQEEVAKKVAPLRNPCEEGLTVRSSPTDCEVGRSAERSSA